MKSSLLLVPTILAASVAIADTQSHAVDAQAQAAGLLVRPHTSPVSKTDGRGRSLPPASRALDAQASAAMLLSGVRPSQPSAASQVDLVTHAREQGTHKRKRQLCSAVFGSQRMRSLGRVRRGTVH
jgi:hypothetical protein